MQIVITLFIFPCGLVLWEVALKLRRAREDLAAASFFHALVNGGGSRMWVGD